MLACPRPWRSSPGLDDERATASAQDPGVATGTSDSAGARQGQDAAAAEADATAPRFGLTTATALIVGTIIGVGIFNLPTSLAAYGPITLVSMGLTTVGALALALLFASLSRR